MAKNKKKSKVKTVFLTIGIIIVAIIVIAGGWSLVVKPVIDRFTGSGADGGEGNETAGDDDKSPVAIISADKTRVTLGDTVFFDGNQSYDPGYTGNLSNRGIMFYVWDFGYTDDDGSPVRETTSVNGTNDHSFPETGEYTVTLTVIDEAEQEDTDQVTINVVPKDQVISTGSSILIGEPIGPGIIGNSTELDWNVSDDATGMVLTVNITGANFREAQQNEINVVLQDPYLDVMENETVEVLGSRSLDWNFTARELEIEGKYILEIRAVNGAAMVSVSGKVTYL